MYQLKNNLKQLALRIKQYVVVHPITTLISILVLIMFMGMALTGVEMVKVAKLVLSGDVANPLNHDQLTGLVFVLAGGFTVLFGWFMSHMFLSYTSDISDREEKKYAIKHVTNYTQTGEGEKQ